MKLETHVAEHVWNYPSLFYRPTWKESQMAVYHHMFMVLGNGMELVLIDGLYQFPPPKPKRNIPGKRIIKRLMVGEPLIEIMEIDVERASKENMVLYKHHGKHRRVFVSDYEKSDYYYPAAFAKPYNLTDTECIYEVFPVEERKNSHPYPFSLEYLPFVKINPHGKEYGYRKKNEIDMPVEELRLSKALIPEDYAVAIVEVYKKALEFYDSPAFMEDVYYGPQHKDAYPASKRFVERIEKALSDDQELALFNNEYAEMLRKDDTVESYCIRRAEERQQQYILLCNKIITAFSD